VREAGRIEPLRSSAGSVGLMQINQHVWRGVYDLNKLAADIGYNARAGNEILVHYLVDFAIKKKEHEVTGDPHNLARATYAVYNGGPGHLRRYRDPKESRSLRDIDSAFWKKYQALRARGVEAVKQCYAQ
jgi:soluble lytic murein transglycosylase-like protein